MPSEIGLTSLAWRTDTKTILQGTLNFSSASKFVLHDGSVPRNYKLLLPDKQVNSESPDTRNEDGSLYDESSTATSSPLSYTKELTNVSSPLTPLSDARRSKSKSPLTANVSKFLVDEEEDNSCSFPCFLKTNREQECGLSNGLGPETVNGDSTCSSPPKQFMGPTLPKTPNTTLKVKELVKEENKGSLSSLFSPSKFKPKTMTIKIGKETIAKKQLTDLKITNNSLVPYDSESEADDSDTEVPNSTRKERPLSPNTIIGPLKPSKIPFTEVKPLSSQKRNGELSTPPATKRKRLLSERGEKEMAYPVMDKNTVSSWNWNGFQYLNGRNRGVGLFNHSNDCFLNAILQLITHTAPLCRYLLEKHDERSCPRPTGMCVACALKSVHLKKALQSSPFPASWTRPHLRRIFPSHMPGMQEDAHELLALMLDAIDPPMSNSKNNNVINGVNTKPSTPIEQIFGGTLRNVVTCDRCGGVYKNYERIRELNLAIKRKPDADSSTISYLIDHYFRDEKLSAFDCKRCAQKTLATRKTQILRPPAVLLVQLKRFNAFGQKIRLPVTAEMEIDISHYISEAAPVACSEYMLTSVVEHLGTTVDHGHYVSYCRGFDNKQWFLFDDETVSGIASQKVVASNPYLLVYSRREDMTFIPKKEDNANMKIFTQQTTMHKTNGYGAKFNGYSTNGSFGRPYKYNYIK